MIPALPLQQHPTFGAALKQLGADTCQIDIGGTSPVQVIRRCGISFATRIRAYDPQLLRRSPLRIINAETPDKTYRQAGFRQIMTPAHVAEIDLTAPLQPHPKWRHSWRKSTVKIRHDIFHPTQHQWLLDADRAQQRTNRYRTLPHAIIHAYAAISPADVIVLTATQSNTPVAAMLFMVHAPVATYQIGWTGDAGREAHAHHALLMQAADHFARQGLTRLDLGTVDTENTPGLARFKIGSGASVRPLGGTWLRLPFA